MEYVTNAQGQTVAVSSAQPVAAVQPAPVGANAAAVSASPVAQVRAATAAPAAITVTGTSILERIKDEYEAEVARVEADVASLKSLKSTVVGDVDADVAVVKGLPKAVKLAIGVVVALAMVASWALGKFL